MSPRRLILLAAVAVVGLLTVAGPWTPAAHAKPVVDEVAGQIICQCGCTYTLEACASAMGCSVGEEMRAEIAAMGTRGMTTAQILDYYVTRYGEKVLAAPTKRGFNLTAWVTPFAAVVAGAAVGALVVYAWYRQRVQATASVEGKRRAELEPYLERVERDLKLEEDP